MCLAALLCQKCLPIRERFEEGCLYKSSETVARIFYCCN